MKKLNSEQKKAIKHGEGPLLIIAGAGTGKTTVITERIKYLIAEGLAKPTEILGLTFTEKSAREMETRVDEALPYGYTQMWLMTFHSFCDRILRLEALNIGLDPKYKLMSEAEMVQLIRKNLFEFELDYFLPLGNPTKYISGMLQHFSRLQDEDISPNDYNNWVKETYKSRKLSEEHKLDKKRYSELAGAYKKYEEIKIREGLMDFGDLIVKTLYLFRSRKNILGEYKKQFKYILVDEYQDTNFAQNELVKILAGKEGNITVVADDDQAIYRWRGAAISNVIQFRKNFPSTKIVTLTKNYRSNQEILDRAYGLIQFNNPDRLEVVESIDKKLISQLGSKGKGPEKAVEFAHCDRVENEADWVAKKILEITSHNSQKVNLDQTSYNYSDFAILVRANNHADAFIRSLGRYGIPHQFLGPGRLFKQSEISDLISFLRVLYDIEDSVSMYRLLSLPYLEIPNRDIVLISNYAKRKNISMFRACEKLDEIDLSQIGNELITKLIKVISENLSKSHKEPAGQLLYFFLEDLGLTQKILNPDTPAAQKRANNIAKFFDKLKTYEVEHEDATVFSVVDWIDLSTELGESPLAADTDWANDNSVKILTVHSSKGLEFPVVFLVNMVTQRFPSTERREQIPIPDGIIKEILPTGDQHLQEERRLFYVGMTRACNKLFLTASDYYGEGKREKKLSQFIFEALGDDMLSAEKELVKGEQLSLLNYKNLNTSLAEETSGQHWNIDYLSISQIETFEICPLHYKLRYIYRLPSLQSASASFGSSIHASLKMFYERIKNGEKPTEKMIQDCLSENWIDEGFSSKSHENKFLEKGKLYLNGFLKNGFDPKVNTVLLEQPFTTNLLTYQEFRERNIRPLKIGGKIDRVDEFPDGTIEIVDYKTSANIPSQRDVDRDMQLSFYAIAAVCVGEPPFTKKPEQIKLSLYYLDTQEKITTTRTQKDLDEAKEKIIAIRQQMETSDFECSGNFLCQNCEYKLLCSVDD